MKKGILMTLPKSDDVTEYLAVFSKEIIDKCLEYSVKIKLLEKDSASKKIFEEMLKSLNFNMIVFNGYGSPDKILGHKNQEIIKLGVNENLLIDRIVYARSCWCLSGIGENKKIKNQNGCFIGYRIPFMFLMDTTRATTPNKDKTAKIFFQTSNMVPLGLIKGHTALESHENSKKSMLKAIKKNLRERDNNSQAIAETLWNNYVSQDLIGNKDVRLI